LGIGHTIRDILIEPLPLSNRAYYLLLPSIDLSLSIFNSSTLNKIALLQTKFPWHYTQHQALGYRKNIPFSNLQSQEQCQQYKLYTIRYRRAGLDSNRDSGLESESESDIDFDRGRQDNSGYSSDTDNKADYLNRLIEKFGEERLQISNLGPVAKEIIQVEHVIARVARRQQEGLQYSRDNSI
jgi:hypothetical protein